MRRGGSQMTVWPGESATESSQCKVEGQDHGRPKTVVG